jgi:TonB-linked SusC/RagA family outer membrane protein
MKQRELFTRLWAKQNKKPYGYFLILLFFASFLNMQNIYSQNKTVTGTVIDESGIPLPGASVSNKDTGNGTQTDFDGKYSISVKDDNATLVFSFLGFTTVEQSVNGKSVLNVTLKEDAESLEEIVVIGYGAIQKKDLTGAITTISSENLTEMVSPNFEQGLQGKIPGMQMTQTSAEPGGGISVKIRGTNSLLGSSEPLYVIDGFPISNDNLSRPGGWEGQGSLNLLSNLNPDDIKSVQVLKDASATAIYGSRGANGVVLIETKKGRSGEGKITIDYSRSMSHAKAPYELSNVYDYARIENERLDLQNANASNYRYTAEPNAFIPEGGASPEQLAAIYGEGTNWVEEVLRPGSVDQLNISFSGGSEKTTYHISGNLYNEKGVVIGSDYIKAGLRANISSQVNDRLKVEGSMAVSRYEADRMSQTGRVLGGGPDRLGTVTAAFRANPIATIDTDPMLDNNLMKYVPGVNNVSNFIYNPVKELNDQDNSDAMNFIIATLKMEVDILDGLKMTLNGGANIQNSERINFLPFSTHVGNWYGGLGTHSFFDSRDFLFENYLNYNKTFNKTHKINAALGYSMQTIVTQNVGLSGSGYDFDIQGIYGWAQQTNPTPPSTSEIGRQIASYYGRLFYSYKDRIMVTLSARQDGASVFAENSKWAFFPSAAIGYVISEESFMQDINWISNLKLRASYGIVGNQSISPYRSLATLSSTGYVLGGTKTSGLGPNTPANPDLIWESTKQLDIGLDATLFDNRLRVGFDYYKKNTVDLLQNKPVPGTTGYSVFTTNFGEISNEGVELMLSATILDGDFGWESTVTPSFNRSKILDLGNAADGSPIVNALTPSGGIADGRTSHRFIVGEPIGTFYGYTVDGMLQQEDVDAGIPFLPGLDEPGDMKVRDINGDGVINPDDQSAIGNAQPDLLFGWDNTFTYKNWSMNVFVNASIGGDVFNMMSIYTRLGSNGGRPSQEYVNDYWTPTNTDAKFPRPGGGINSVNTFLLEDASFVRLQTVSLNYRLPELDFIGDGDATVYIRGNNLLVWDNYSGFDPETGFAGQRSWAPNVDLGNFPRPRTVQLGIKVSF